LIPLQGGYPFKFERLQAGTNHENIRIAVLDVSIVNDKGSCAKISVGPNVCRAILSANVVGEPLVGFHRKDVLIGERMGRSNGIYIIGFAIAFGTEVTIANIAIGFKFKYILWGYI